MGLSMGSFQKIRALAMERSWEEGEGAGGSGAGAARDSGRAWDAGVCK